MRKMLLSISALLLVLCGCQNANAKAQNAKQEAFNVAGTSITNDDLYYMLMSEDLGSLNYIIADLEEAIFDEIAPVDEEIETKAKELLANAKEQYGDYFDFFISYAGYGNEDAFYEGCVSQARYVKMASAYIEEKYATLSVTSKPRKVQVAVFKTEENATAALDALKSGTAIKDLTVTEDDTILNEGEEFIVTTGSTSSVDADALNIICGTAVNGPIVSVLSGSDKKYYVANVVEANPDNFKEEAIEAIANTINVENDALRYFLQKRHFKITDTYTHEMFAGNSTYSDFIFD